MSVILATGLKLDSLVVDEKPKHSQSPDHVLNEVTKPPQRVPLQLLTL